MPNHLYKIGDKVRITTVSNHYPFRHGVVIALKNIAGNNVYRVKSSTIEKGKIVYNQRFYYEQCLTHLNQSRKLIRPLKIGDFFFVASNIGTIDDYNMRSYSGKLMPVIGAYRMKQSLPGSYTYAYNSTNDEDIYWTNLHMDVDKTNQLLLSNQMREKSTPNLPTI